MSVYIIRYAIDVPEKTYKSIGAVQDKALWITRCTLPVKEMKKRFPRGDFKDFNDDDKGGCVKKESVYVWLKNVTDIADFAKEVGTTVTVGLKTQYDLPVLLVNNTEER